MPFFLHGVNAPPFFYKFFFFFLHGVIAPPLLVIVSDGPSSSQRTAGPGYFYYRNPGLSIWKTKTHNFFFIFEVWFP